jgi:hypothetical protein
MGRTEKFKPEDMVKAIEDSNGGVYLAARRLGCDPATITNYRRKYPEVELAITRCRGELIDEAESSLLSAIKAKEGWAVCFALKCLGKDRGYIETQRTEHSGSIGLDLTGTDAGVPTREELVNRVKKHLGGVATATNGKHNGNGHSNGHTNGNWKH